MEWEKNNEVQTAQVTIEDHLLLYRLSTAMGAKMADRVKEYKDDVPCKRCGGTKNHFNKEYCYNCQKLNYDDIVEKLARRDRTHGRKKRDRETSKSLVDSQTVS